MKQPIAGAEFQFSFCGTVVKIFCSLVSLTIVRRFYCRSYSFLAFFMES